MSGDGNKTVVCEDCNCEMLEVDACWVFNQDGNGETHYYCYWCLIGKCIPKVEEKEYAQHHIA